MARSSGPRQSLNLTGLKSRLAERLREALREEIVAGRWKNQLPGERELSRQLQVSRPTLRLALWALDREGLLKVRTGQPSLILPKSGPIRGTQGRRPEVLLLRDARMKPDLTSQSLWSDHLRDRLHDIGLGLHTVDALARGVKGLPQTLAAIDARYSPSFFVLWSLPPAAHYWFAQRKLPAVIIGSPAPNVPLPAMDLDLEATVRHAVNLLVRRGHRRLALLNIPPDTIGSVAADEYFLRTCAEVANEQVHGVVAHSILRPEAVETAIRRFMTGSAPPTAIIAIDLELIISIYSTLGMLGKNVPRDVSVISTSHWKILDFLRPPPTCYHLSWEKLANRVARLIRDYQQLRVWPTRFWKIMPTFREGMSVAAPRGGGK